MKLHRNRNNVVLLTGCNLGNRLSQINQAKEMITMNIGNSSSISPIVKSKAWGFNSDEFFLNQVMNIETEFSAKEVLSLTQEIELKLGRTPKKEQWSSRLIDIDILFFNNEIIESEQLTIPHKYIQDRRFTLFALDLIMPNYIHPSLNQKIHKLLSGCTDKSEVEVYHV